MRIALALLLVCHGAVHAVMWTLPLTDAVDDMPFDPADSWALGHRPTIGLALAGATAAGLLGAAVGVAFGTSWWPPVLATSAVVSLLLMGLFLSRYWAVGIALSAALVVYGLRADPS